MREGPPIGDKLRRGGLKTLWKSGKLQFLSVLQEDQIWRGV